MTQDEVYGAMAAAGADAGRVSEAARVIVGVLDLSPLSNLEQLGALLLVSKSIRAAVALTEKDGGASFLAQWAELERVMSARHEATASEVAKEHGIEPKEPS